MDANDSTTNTNVRRSADGASIRSIWNTDSAGRSIMEHGHYHPVGTATDVGSQFAAQRPPAASSCPGVDSPHTCAIVVKRRRLPEGTAEFFRGMRSRWSLTGSIRQTLFDH